MLRDIINYHEISPALGTAGQPAREQFPALREAGYQVVINLATPLSWDALADEAALVRDLGMEYIPIPVIWEAPQAGDLAQFFAALEANRGRKVFVHCARNYRVSCFVFLYRVLRLGVPEAAALPDLLRLWQPDETWQKFIDGQLQNRV